MNTAISSIYSKISHIAPIYKSGTGSNVKNYKSVRIVTKITKEVDGRKTVKLFNTSKTYI